MKSVFRLAARRTNLRTQPPEPEAAPVSEKCIGLNRSHLRHAVGPIGEGDLTPQLLRPWWSFQRSAAVFNSGRCSGSPLWQQWVGGGRSGFGQRRAESHIHPISNLGRERNGGFRRSSHESRRSVIEIDICVLPLWRSRRMSRSARWPRCPSD